MGFKITIVNEQGKPLSGTATYFNDSGKPVGTQGVPQAGVELDNQLLQASASLSISSTGYGWYKLPVGNIYGAGYDEIQFTLVRKPQTFLYFLGGVALGIGSMLYLQLSNRRQ